MQNENTRIAYTAGLSAFAKSIRKGEADMDSVRNIADTPIFSRKGGCKDQTAGRGG